MPEKMPSQVDLIEWRKERENEEVRELCRFFTDQEFLDLYSIENEKDINHKRKFNRPVIISQTMQGFSVNRPAETYATKILLRLNLLNENLKVKDLPGNQKYVPFEPSYVSTSEIFVLPVNELRKEHGIYNFMANATILPSGAIDKINKWIDSDISEDELKIKLEKNIQGDEYDVFPYVNYLMLFDYIIDQRKKNKIK